MYVPSKEAVEVLSNEQLITVKLNLEGAATNEGSRTLEFGSTKYFSRKAGDFIYGKQNLFNGAFDIINDDLDGLCTSGDVPALRFKETLISKFYYYQLSKSYKGLYKIATGSGSKRVHENTLLDSVICIPSVREQTSIGTIFFVLDNLITLHQRD